MSTTLTKKYVEARLQVVEDERQDLLAAMRVLERAATEVAPDEDAGDGPMWPDVEIDFTGVANNRDRVVRIAQAVEGTFSTKDLAKCLVERGQSKAKVENLRSHVSNAIAGDLDFIKTDDGKYRYGPKTAAMPGLLTESTR